MTKPIPATVSKPIKGYEDCYQVTNDGQIISLERAVIMQGYSRQIKARLRKLNKGRYMMVCLTKGGSRETRLVHRLVAEAFIPNPNSLPCINHKDFNTHNNRVDNLEWCTYKDNTRHRYANNHCGRVYTDEQIVEARRLDAGGLSRREIREKLGITTTSLQAILTGHSWKHLK